jgi:hypothetical protein
MDSLRLQLGSGSKGLCRQQFNVATFYRLAIVSLA